MSISRRQAILAGITFGVALNPLDIEAASTPFGILVDAIGETIIQSATVISAVTEQVNKAVSNGIGIYDKIKLAELRGTLQRIAGEMSSLNGDKRANIDAFRDYINKEPLADTWPTLQAQCKNISMELDELLAHLGSDNSVLLSGTDLATAGDLKALLLHQSSIYLRLSTLAEPITDDDRKKFAAVIDKLDELLKKVVALESSIQVYLNKFSTDTP
jgi:hypothetical protein